MKRTILIILCLAVFSLTSFAQGGNHPSRKARGKAKVVTATGCIRQGVECLVLEPLGGGQSYSVARSRKLAVGRAYRITGPTSDIGFCMEGFPILSPQRVTLLKTRCPKAGRNNANALSESEETH